jgi:hypothetical protein
MVTRRVPGQYEVRYVRAGNQKDDGDHGKQNKQWFLIFASRSRKARSGGTNSNMLNFQHLLETRGSTG